MNFARRNVLQLAAETAAISVLPRIALAQTYPTRPLRCIVGYPPGGGTDIFVRLVGQSLPSRLGQPFIIENRGGAAGNVATDAVVRAPADGYTLLGIDTAVAINASLYSNLSFNFMNDIALVAMTRGPLVLTVHPSVPAKTVPELIAYAKSNPGRINFGSSGIGSSLHMAGELFKQMAAINIVHVPYRGAAPAITDLLGGQVQLMFLGLPPSGEHIRVGKLRALAVTTSTRWGTLSNTATLSDFLPGYEASQWWAIGVRKSTQAPIIERLNKEMNATLADAKMEDRLAELGSELVAASPADLEKFLAGDIEKWAKVVKLSGAKAE
jgi:tripartite-type tricarboxylate transporter receptor subunit TctC